MLSHITDTFSPETKNIFKGGPLWKPWMDHVRLRLISSIAELEEFLAQGSNYKRVSWDLESRSLNPDPSEVVGHCLAFNTKEAVYIPTNHVHRPEFNLDSDLVWDLVLKCLDTHEIVVYNWKYEGWCLKQLGKKPKTAIPKVHDVLIYNWLSDSDQLSFGLKNAAQRVLGHDMLNIRDVPGAARDAKKEGDVNFGYTNPLEAVLYAAADPVMTLGLLEVLENKVVREQQQSYILQLEHKVLDVCFQLESFPIMMDRPFLQNSLEDINRWIKALSLEIYDIAGYSFNISAPRDVGTLLELIGVENLDKTPSGQIATGSGALDKVKHEYPVIQKILLYRSLVKERSTYIEALLDGTDDLNPYARFKLKSIGAPTGRFSGGGRTTGESQYLGVNPQAIPNAGKYSLVPAKRLKNPPLGDMDAQLSGLLDDEIDIPNDEESGYDMWEWENINE